jgi:hypothetical protein
MNSQTPHANPSFHRTCVKRHAGRRIQTLNSPDYPHLFYLYIQHNYVEFSITLNLYFINQHITGPHRIDVEAIPGALEQIKTLKTSKPFRNACTSVDS